MTRPLKTGSLIYVRYRDHVVFRDMDPDEAASFTREAIGWLDYEDDEWVRIVHERFAMPDPPNESKRRASGFVILKKAIVQMRRIG